MKLTDSQKAVLEAMARSPDGVVTSGQGFKRITVEAMERKGLVFLECTPEKKHVRHRNGRMTVRMTVRWKAKLLPLMPSQEELEELDLIGDAGEKLYLESQQRQAAAYLALTAPKVGLLGSPASIAPSDPTEVFLTYLSGGPDRLLAEYRMYRHLAGEHPLTAPPESAEADSPWGKSDVWVVLGGGRELGRVQAEDYVNAKILANSLLNRRGGYGIRRLRTCELQEEWVKDIRVDDFVLRVERVPGGCRVRHLGGPVVTERPTAAQAEAHARALLL